MPWTVASQRVAKQNWMTSIWSTLHCQQRNLLLQYEFGMRHVDRRRPTRRHHAKTCPRHVLTWQATAARVQLLRDCAQRIWIIGGVVCQTNTPDGHPRFKHSALLCSIRTGTMEHAAGIQVHNVAKEAGASLTPAENAHAPIMHIA